MGAECVSATQWAEVLGVTADSLSNLLCLLFFVFFFNDTATTEIYTLSLHDALPISLYKKVLEINILDIILQLILTLILVRYVTMTCSNNVRKATVWSSFDST